MYDEIIIGSGMAGLYWVYKSKPSNFLILEKSNRIGGRIYNIEWNNNQISLGGGIIKSSNNYTIKLAEELGFELGEGISKYEMIDWTNKKIVNAKPNEEEFYLLNTNIIKYLKKIHQINEKEIDKNNLNFEEFLDLYVEFKISELIKSNILYKTYYKSDVKSVLYDEMDELLRTQDFKYKFIKNGGYTLLLNKLIELIDKKNIILNSNVIEIKKNNDLFEIITDSKQIFNCKKIIVATESNNNIIFNISNKDIINKFINLYQSVSYSNYLRIYSYHNKSHGLKYSYKTNGLVGKVIPINDNILMCSYTEEIDAFKLNKLLKDKPKTVQIEMIHKLLNKCNIPINKPDDLIIKYWNCGVHYNNPGYNKKYKKYLINELIKENIIVIGECISDTHGWVNSALESVDSILN